MDPTVRYAMEQKLRKERARLWEEAMAADSELQAVADTRDSELEETAQHERLAEVTARLDVRAKHEIEEIDAALMRLADGRYGTCLACGRRIAIARLQIVPATRFCARCARSQTPEPTAREASVVPPAGASLADAGLLTDREIESRLRELVHDNGRVDMEELRIVCRHGVVYLDGALPSDTEAQIVRRIVTDYVGMREVVDRLRINELSWERPDRSKAPEGMNQVTGLQADVTDDVVRGAEEGLDYVAPELPAEPEK